MKADTGLSGLSGLVGNSGGTPPTGTSTRSPASAVSNGTGGGVAWTSPGNVLADDANYASVTLLPGESSEWLDCTEFGFSLPAVDVTAVTAEVKALTLAGTADDDAAVLHLTGASLDGHYGTDQAGSKTVTTTEGYLSPAYGGDPFAVWGIVRISAGIVTEPSFGFRWAVVNNSVTDTVTVRVNHIRMTVTW